MDNETADRLDLMERQLTIFTIQYKNLNGKLENWVHTLDILSIQFNNLQFKDGGLLSLMQQSKFIIDKFEELKKEFNDTLDIHHDRIHKLEIKDNLKIEFKECPYCKKLYSSSYTHCATCDFPLNDYQKD